MVKETNTAIFAIGLGTRVDRLPSSGSHICRAVRHISRRGRRAEDQYLRIVENLRRRYVLSYTSTKSRGMGPGARSRLNPVLRDRGDEPRRLLCAGALRSRLSHFSRFCGVAL